MTQLRESKEDIRKFTDWIINSKSRYDDISKEEASDYARTLVDRFLEMKSRLKSPYNDLYYWIKLNDVDELEDYLHKLDLHIKSRKDTEKKEQEGARLVYSDNDWKVYEITSYEASAKYGKNTKWCITGSKRWADRGDGREFWDGYYSKEGVRFYFFIKSNDEKYALAVYPGDKYCEIYNSEDVQIPFIPNAPLIDEIKVNYSDNSPGNILINAIMSKKIPENVLFQIFEEVLYDNTGFNVEIYSRTTFKDFISSVSNMIPEGFIEYGSVENDSLSVDEYERITGEKFIPGGWGGDISSLTDLYAYEGNTKEEVLKTIASNESTYDYFVIDEDYEGYQLIFIKDWVELFMYANSKSNVSEWNEFDIDEFFENNELGGSRASIFAVMCANQLIADIKNGEVSKNVLYNIPNLPNDFIDSIKESFDNLLKEDEKVSRIVKNDANIFYHGSVEDISDSLNKPINWITKDYNYAKTFALDSGYVYTCEATLGNLFDVGKTDARVYDLLPIKPFRLSRDFEAIVRKLNLSENVVKKLLENVIDEYQLEANGYKLMIRPVVRSVAFKRILESLGYNGIKAIEYDSVNNKDVETFGIFDSVKIIDRKKVNESLKEDYEDFEITEDELENYLEMDTKYSKQLSSPNSEGPMIVLSNGSIYDISSYETHSMFAGAFAGHLNYDYDEFDDFDSDALDYLQDELGVVTLNPGDNAFEDRLKIVSGGRPTNEQFDVIRDFIDNMQIKFKNDTSKPLYVYIGSLFNCYVLNEYTSDEFIKKFKLAFVRGRLEEKNYNMPTKMYDLNNDEVTWDRDAEDNLYWGSEADKWAEDYAKSYKAKISPRDFLRLTTLGRDVDALSVGDNLGFAQLKDLDVDELNKETHQPIFLQIAFRDRNNPNKAQVVGHEGRHRMFALWKAGYNKVDVELKCDVYNTRYQRSTPFKLDYIELKGQFNKMVSVIVENPIPMSWKNHKEIRPELRDESLKEYFDTIEGDWPIYVTDEVYKVKNMLEKGDAPYRIYYDDIAYFIQDARGNKTHGDMMEDAFYQGLIHPDSNAIYERSDGTYDVDIFDDDVGFMVFIPKGFHGSLRYFTSLGQDSYYDCRVYSFGVIFVRDSETYYNSLFDALGEPEREINYDSYEDMIYIISKGKTKEVSVFDLPNNNPNDAIDMNLKDEIVNEAMRGRNSLTNERVKKYVEECIDKMKTINYGLVSQDMLTFDDIDVEEGDSIRTFGVMQLPKDDFGNFKLILNKHMFEEPEEAIKNTIYHELCHYVVDKLAIDKDIFYHNNGSWYMRTRMPYAKNYTGHGQMWKYIANVVSKATNQNIQRTGDYEMHTGVGQHAEDSYKYILKCKHCGHEFKYSRMSPFVKDVISHDGHSEDWYCTCDDGTKSHDFEIVKGK